MASITYANCTARLSDAPSQPAQGMHDGESLHCSVSLGKAPRKGNNTSRTGSMDKCTSQAALRVQSLKEELEAALAVVDELRVFLADAEAELANEQDANIIQNSERKKKLTNWKSPIQWG
jgi:hypothetical protein